MTYVDDYRNSPALRRGAIITGSCSHGRLRNSFQGTDRTDKAVFGEIDIELIENKLTALVGGRWYEVDRELSYTVERPDSRVAQALPDRTASDDGFTPKYGLEFYVNNDVMLYGVYSEGYRVGGTNRGRTRSRGAYPASSL